MKTRLRISQLHYLNLRMEKKEIQVFSATTISFYLMHSQVLAM